jgi:putative oxidoreductase
MKIAKQIPAILLGLVYAVFGMAYFLKLIPTPEMQGDMATFMSLFGSSGYMTVVKVLEVAIGLLLLLPKTRAMALLLIAPISVNILLFELCIAKQPGIGIALVAINAIGIYLNREKYWGILA